MATARVPFNMTPVSLDHERNSSKTYAVGFKERYRITVSANESLDWRRIVFAYKGNPYGTYNSTGQSDQPYYFDTTAAVTRWFSSLGATASANLRQILFRGTGGTDWNDVLSAHVDTRRVRVLYDRVRNLRPSVAGVSHTHFSTYGLQFVQNLSTMTRKLQRMSRPNRTVFRVPVVSETCTCGIMFYPLILSMVVL